MGWSEKPLDDISLYAVIEDVQENYEEYPGESKTESRSEERTLEMDEKILEVQTGWSGKGRFILKQITEVKKKNNNIYLQFQTSCFFFKCGHICFFQFFDLSDQ